jgi:tRNA(fMet)-specific endonuclease VapC
MISLDTNAVISVINSGPSAVRERLQRAFNRDEAVWISSIVLFELRYGIAISARRERNAARLTEFTTGLVQTLPFNSEDAEEAGELRAQLERAGTPIGFYDLLIAAQALRRGALVVTANVREFARVPGLQVENWTTPL